MLVELFIKRLKNGRYIEVPKGSSYRFHHYVIWKVVTVGTWKKINSKENQEILLPSTLEERLWEYNVEDSSFLEKVSKEKRFTKDGYLTTESLNRILSFQPSWIPKRLVLPLYKTFILTEEEVDRIQREYQIIWGGGGKSLTSIHPILEEALNGMMLEDKFGIPLYSSISEISQKTLTGFRVVSNIYGKLLEMDQKKYELQEKAAQKVGLRVGQYTTHE